MSWTALTGLLLLTGVAAYAQTLTGFAFGLITMGGVGLTGLLSLPEAAMLVSLLTLVNAAQMLTKGWRDVDWRSFGLVMLTGLPCLCLGFFLLDWLAESRADWLRLALGATMLGAALNAIAVPLFGHLSDRIGRRPVYLAGALLGSMAQEILMTAPCPVLAVKAS